MSSVIQLLLSNFPLVYIEEIDTDICRVIELSSFGLGISVCYVSSTAADLIGLENTPCV